jgi:ketosteroid isomerase-like protein
MSASADVVRHALDAYHRRDIAAMRALNHPDMELD